MKTTTKNFVWRVSHVIFLSSLILMTFKNSLVHAQSPLSAAETYLSYRETLRTAKEFDELLPYLAEWIVETSLQQSGFQTQEKLETLKTSMREVHIIGERNERSATVLDIVSVNEGGQDLPGEVTLVTENGYWKIDDIAWFPLEPKVQIVEQVSVVPSDENLLLPLDENTNGDAIDNAALNEVPLDRRSIQRLLNRNPFLKRYNVGLTVLALEDGFLTLEMTQGPKTLVAKIRAGFDFIEGDLGELDNDHDRQTMLAVNKVIRAYSAHNALASILVVVPSDAELKARETAYQEKRERRKHIQIRLTDLGYEPGPVDGLAGKTTRAAIREYQRAAGLAVNGIPSVNLLQHMSLVAVVNPARIKVRKKIVLESPASTTAASVKEKEAKPMLKEIFRDLFIQSKTQDSHTESK